MKNYSVKTKNRSWFLRRQFWIVAIACGGIFSAAHASEGTADIFDTLAKKCDSNLGGSKYPDAVLEEFRGKNFSSPKTGGFTVTSVTPQVTGFLPLIGHCLVKGTIQPTSPERKDPFVKPQLADKVPDINFQVYIPSRWNGKLVQLGGGGFAWPADMALNKLLIDFLFKKSLLGPGVLDEYAVVTSDAGNVDPNNPTQPGSGGGFVKEANSVNEIAKQELVKNFGRDSIKKSLDVGLDVVKRLTGTLPKDRYFVGFSTGGRQALMAVANWPDAYDGAVSGAPPAYETRLIKSGLKDTSTPIPGENPFSSGLAVLGYIFGKVDWSNPIVVKSAIGAFMPALQEMTRVAVNSGANNDPADSLMDALEPVWDIKPGDVNRFLEMPASSNGKRKKLILLQGTSDPLVPCTATAKFVRDAADLYSKDYTGVLPVARAFFIKDFSHGFFTAKGNAFNLSWDAVSALDQWVYDDNAKIGAPRNALDPTGKIPGRDDLTSWGCTPAVYK